MLERDALKAQLGLSSPHFLVQEYKRLRNYINNQLKKEQQTSFKNKIVNAEMLKDTKNIWKFTECMKFFNHIISGAAAAAPD